MIQLYLIQWNSIIATDGGESFCEGTEVWPGLADCSIFRAKEAFSCRLSRLSRAVSESLVLNSFCRWTGQFSTGKEDPGVRAEGDLSQQWGSWALWAVESHALRPQCVVQACRGVSACGTTEGLWRAGGYNSSWT